MDEARLAEIEAQVQRSRRSCELEWCDSPSVILALVAEVRRLRAENETLREAAQPCRRQHAIFTVMPREPMYLPDDD
jgi:hypothetical protein